MKKPYIVALGEGFPRKDLLEKMDQDARFGAWFHSMPNSFIVYSSVDAKAIDAFIKEKIGDTYRYFITEIIPENRQGWMPQSHWEIMHHNGAEKKFELDFKGYYLDSSNLPETSGVYCVYKCIYSTTNDSVELKELLYIGKSENIHERHLNHENKAEWELECHSGERLCYTFATVDVVDLTCCEAALIYNNKPKCNHEGKDSFTHEDVYLVTRGSNRFLSTDVLVEKTV